MGAIAGDRPLTLWDIKKAKVLGILRRCWQLMGGWFAFQMVKPYTVGRRRICPWMFTSDGITKSPAQEIGFVPSGLLNSCLCLKNWGLIELTPAR